MCAAQIRPLEESYKFGAFFSSYLNESDFYAKPSVLLLGQYSTGVQHSQVSPSRMFTKRVYLSSETWARHALLSVCAGMSHS